jgi:hypothetical protein
MAELSEDRARQTGKAYDVSPTAHLVPPFLKHHCG